MVQTFISKELILSQSFISPVQFLGIQKISQRYVGYFSKLNQLCTSLYLSVCSAFECVYNFCFLAAYVMLIYVCLHFNISMQKIGACVRPFCVFSDLVNLHKMLIVSLHKTCIYSLYYFILDRWLHFLELQK